MNKVENWWMAEADRGTGEKKLGEGSYASVIRYRYNDEDCALKYYATPVGTGLSTAYREIEMLSSLSHPNIIGYKGYYAGPLKANVKMKSDEEDGQLHIVMDLASSSLTTLIREKARTNRGAPQGMTESVVKRCAADILLGLECIHVNGIIHRDISCNNILVMPDGRLVICDFGMSKYFVSQIEPNDVYVNPEYRSPEMHAGSWYDSRVDVWSAGVVIQMLLLGMNPFSPNRSSGNDMMATVGRLISHIPLLPLDLEKWLSKCGLSLRATLQRRLEDRQNGVKMPMCSRLSVEARSFLSRALCFHVKHRATAADLLNDSWLDSERDRIVSVRKKFLRETVTLSRPSLVFPSASVRRVIKSFILTLGDGFGERRGEARVNRISLSLTILYRVLSRSSRLIESDIEQGYLIPLYITCLIIAIKYYSTNTVAIDSSIVPENLRSYCTPDYIREREYHILELLCCRIYSRTTYDISLGMGIAFGSDDRESLWEYYTDGKSGEHNVESEFSELLRLRISSHQAQANK